MPRWKDWSKQSVNRVHDNVMDVLEKLLYRHRQTMPMPVDPLKLYRSMFLGREQEVLDPMHNSANMNAIMDHSRRISCVYKLTYFFFTVTRAVPYKDGAILQLMTSNPYATVIEAWLGDARKIEADITKHKDVLCNVREWVDTQDISPQELAFLWPTYNSSKTTLRDFTAPEPPDDQKIKNFKARYIATKQLPELDAYLAAAMLLPATDQGGEGLGLDGISAWEEI